MSEIQIHGMDTAWVSSNPSLLQSSVDSFSAFPESGGSNRLEAQTGSSGTSVESVPAVPLNLGAFDELRFWIAGNPIARGTADRPFLLEFFFTDAGDGPGDEHRWFISINRSNAWEQRRIGIENDRRTAVDRLGFRSLTSQGFLFFVDELLAVREDMLADLETALIERLGECGTLSELTDRPFMLPAAPTATDILVQTTPGFAPGNRVLLTGGSAGDEVHEVTAVTQETVGTRLTFAAGDSLLGQFTVPGGLATVQVPAVVEAPPVATIAPSPAIVVTHLDLREDLARTFYYTQTDSYRPRGGVIECSTRLSPRAYLIDYQVTIRAPHRAQQRAIHDRAVDRLTIDRPLRLYGFPAYTEILAPPVLSDVRQTGLLAPIFVRFGTHKERAPRRTRVLVRDAGLAAARLGAPADREEVTVT